MTADPLVSCVIPVFNAARFLEETLASVFAQTHPAVEVIAVDDGSTDGSAEVLARHAGRVTCLRQANRGEAAARNAGLAAANGAFIAFLDADDLWAPDKITRQLARLREEPGIDLSFTAFRNFWMPEVESEAQHFADHALSRPSYSWSVCTLVAPRQVFARFGPFDEQLRSLPNMTWFVRAAGRGARVDVLREVLMRRRLHDANATRAATGLDPDEFLPLLKAWRDLRRDTSRGTPGTPDVRSGNSGHA
jgi:glycosyltransferase involved in cell wall biosynthesis